MSAPNDGEWISGLRTPDTRHRLCALQRLAVIGKVRTLVEPGLSPRYNRADVERVAAAENKLEAVAC